MKTIDKIKNWLFIGMVALGTSAAMVACDDDDTVYAYDSQLHSFGPSPATRGETVRFLGEGLAGVNKIIFPVGVEVTDFVNKTNSEIVCVVPQDAVPGRIILMCGGTEILSKSTLTFSEPITVESVTAEKANLTAGDRITIKGDYLYNIASVTFGNEAVVTPEDFEKQVRDELVVKVPATAKTGKIALSDGAEWSFVTDDIFTITTAEVTGLDPDMFDYGDEVKIVGVNLQLVSKVWFPGEIEAEFTLNPDATEITTTAPEGTAPGVIELELFSGDRIATPEFTMPVVEVTSVAPSRNLVPGQKVKVKGSLLDRVVAIEFPGGETARSGWAVNNEGTEMEVTIPNSMVDGKMIFVQNENVKISSPALTMAKDGNVFWVGNCELPSNWGNNLEVGKDKDKDLWETFSAVITQPGRLVIHFTPADGVAASEIKLQPRYRRDWSIGFESVRDINGGIISMSEGQTKVEINITAEDITELNGDGWAFSGCNMTLTSMEFENPDAPKTFLTLNFDISAKQAWDNMEISPSKDEDLNVIWYALFKDNITRPGVLTMGLETYTEVPDGEEIQLQCRYLADGWKHSFETQSSVVNIAPGTRAISIPITQRDIDALQGQGEFAGKEPWETGWAFSGKYFIVKSFAFKAN